MLFLFSCWLILLLRCCLLFSLGQNFTFWVRNDDCDILYMTPISDAFIYLFYACFGLSYLALGAKPIMVRFEDSVFLAQVAFVIDFTKYMCWFFTVSSVAVVVGVAYCFLHADLCDYAVFLVAT